MPFVSTASVRRATLLSSVLGSSMEAGRAAIEEFHAAKSGRDGLIIHASMRLVKPLAIQPCFALRMPIRGV
jgi:hypothetical protein